MYSTTHSIMYPNARHHSLYPFLEELIFITRRNYLDNNNVGWVGVGGWGLGESEDDDEEYALYPDTDSGYDDDCICEHCAKRISERYDPPITRLQLRNKQKLLNLNEKILESYTNLSYYLFEYMEEQKQYTKEEVEQKLEDHDAYITEQEYRKKCDSIKNDYEEQKDSIKLLNDIYFTQSLMKDYEFDKYIDNCKEEYEENMEKIYFLKCDIDLLKL